MTQALTSYYPFVVLPIESGAVSIRRSWNGGHSYRTAGIEMPDCGRDELIKRHRGLVGWPYVPRLKITHRLFAARCVAAIIDRGRLLPRGDRPKPRLLLSCLRVAPEAADYCSRPID